jgi:lipopolysaccharide biosynthesis regulator YciM
MNWYRILVFTLGALPLVLFAQDKEALQKEKIALKEKTAIFDNISKYIVSDYSGVLDGKNNFDNTNNKSLKFFLDAQANFKSSKLSEAKTSIEKCLNLSPKNLLAIQLAIDIAYASANTGDLEKYYAKLYDLTPTDEDLLLSLIEYYDGIGNFSKGKRFSEELVELKGKEQQIAFYRARVMLSNNFIKPAAELLYTNLDKGFHVQSFSLLYRIENINGNGQKLNDLKALAPKSYLNSLDFVILNLPLFIESEQYNLVIDLFDTLTASDMEFAQHILDYPSVFLSGEALSRNEKILSYFDRLEMAIGNEDPRLALCKGNLALNSNNLNLAIEQYTLFAQTPPVEISKVIDLSNYLFTVSPQSSLVFLQSFEDYFPDAPILFTYMAKCQLALKNITAADKDLTTAQALFFEYTGFEYWEYLKVKILSISEQKDKDAYASILSKNADFFSSGGEFLMYNAYQLKALFSDPADALDVLVRNLKATKNDNAKAFLNSLIAILALDLQDQTMAKEALTSAAEANAECTTYILAQAEYHRFLGENSKALKYYKRAQEKDPNFAYISLIIEKLS